MGGWDLPDLLIERGIFEEECYVAEGVFLVLPSAGSVVAFHDIKPDNFLLIPIGTSNCDFRCQLM